ncbi:unnamed protein product [Didymodactylos carnosus]|uniref:Uncharacterized protein n=1 Tax=Didymodactylos carnosus TaxID=1234261 RepID=A0A814KF18_9BILA|nr:unnamed protein product [Didymodactylos carnosus]CAF3820321.1 unnamed protein product [Didymodactylos carnosus]
MNVNWYGISQAFNYTVEQLLQLGVPPSAKLILEQAQKGVGCVSNLYGNPYAMSEEFVSVYRMHSFLPDYITVIKTKNIKNKNKYAKILLSQLTFKNAEKQLKRFSIENWINTFGYTRSGHLVFNNYPDFLTHVKLNNKKIVNLGVIDIVRDRERLGLRYNELRRQLKLEPLISFTNLSVTEGEAKQLVNIYENNIEMVDVLVGLMAEANWPFGYGFSNTAFQIFIIMASRRIETDRFFQEYYNADTYTQLGIDYIQNESFKSILLRNIPDLAENLANVINVFVPW